VNVTRILSGERFTPLPYDPPPIIGIAPVERHALAGWLVLAGREDRTPPFEWWDPAMSGLLAFERALEGGPPADWRQWFEQFMLVEGVLHGRAAGWADTVHYEAVEGYLGRHGAPELVRETVALLRGLRTLDLAAASAAADALRLTDPTAPQLLPPGIALDAAVAAYLGAGRTDRARAAFEAQLPRTDRPPDDVRNLALAALVGAEPPVGR
jgi:hypothetical protein